MHYGTTWASVSRNSMWWSKAKQKCHNLPVLELTIVSVDAFTIGMSIVPTNTNCPQLVCNVPPFLGGLDPSSTLCPASNLILAEPGKSLESLDQVYGCLSDCALHETDRYCCRGPYGSEKSCKSSNPWFKEACPDAYSYAYDDPAAVRVCGLSDVTIAFDCKKR